jgi:hypothetical protein
LEHLDFILIQQHHCQFTLIGQQRRTVIPGAPLREPGTHNHHREHGFPGLRLG